MRNLLIALLLAGGATELSAQPASPLWGHPRNDPIIGIIAQVPSSAGMWVGPGQHLLGALTNLEDSTKLRGILTRFVASPNRSFLQRDEPGYGIVIEKARYSYAQLTEWAHKLEGVTPSLTGIGVDEMKNRVGIMVGTDAAVAQTRTVVARLAIPMDAVTISQATVVQD
jgi:hypothetical protein